MTGSWVVWVALVILVLSHVAMFAAGVGAYHCLRWINIRPVMPKPALSEQKLAAMAEKIALQQASAERFAWLERNQMGGRQVAEVEDSFVPKQK